MESVLRRIAGLVFCFFLLLLVPIASAATYTITDLGALGGLYSNARDINNSGQVVGTVNASGEEHAFLWDSSTGMIDIGTLGGALSYGAGINDSGQVVGSASLASGYSRAFLWDASTGMADLGTLGGSASYANGINDSGQAVGWFYETTGGRKPFLWDGTSMLNLNNLIAPGPGWVLGRVYSINDAGQIVGAGSLDGESHALLLSPNTVPVPGALLLGIMGVGVVGITKRCLKQKT